VSSMTLAKTCSRCSKSMSLMFIDDDLTSRPYFFRTLRTRSGDQTAWFSATKTWECYPMLTCHDEYMETDKRELAYAEIPR
jgi:hypothetical protein